MTRTAPVDPAAAPGGPGGPAGPGGPRSPFSPCGPGGPGSPFGPAGPATPCSPFGPIAPSPQPTKQLDGAITMKIFFIRTLRTRRSDRCYLNSQDTRHDLSFTNITRFDGKYSRLGTAHDANASGGSNRARARVGTGFQLCNHGGPVIIANTE